MIDAAMTDGVDIARRPNADPRAVLQIVVVAKAKAAA